MKNFILKSVFLSVISFTACFSQDVYYVIDSVEAGACPAEVFMERSRSAFYAVCFGNDNNKNGIKDEGDASPSIWKIEIGGNRFSNTRKLMELGFNSLKFPVRFDYKGDTLLLPTTKGVLEIDCAKGEIINSYVNVGAPSDAKYCPEGLMLSVPVEIGGVGKVIIYDPKNKTTIREIPVGVNLLQALPIGERKFAALCVGPYDEDSSEVWIGESNEDYSHTEYMKIPVGGMANHLYFNSGRLYATSFASHKVERINATYGYSDSLCVGTTEGNGPRESKPLYDNILVTTYAGELRVFNCCGGADPLSVTRLNGVAEGLCGYYDYEGAGGIVNVFVASPFNLDRTPGNRIYFLQKKISSIYEPVASAPFSVFPTPANESINIAFVDGTVGDNIEIRDIFGRSMKTMYNIGSNSNINIADLSPGAYFAIVAAEGKTWSAPFTVVR